jgi:hypothetical protein
METNHRTCARDSPPLPTETKLHDPNTLSYLMKSISFVACLETEKRDLRCMTQQETDFRLQVTSEKLGESELEQGDEIIKVDTGWCKREVISSTP